MGRLINAQAVGLLIAGAAVVDLVKVHTVQLADDLGHCRLLIRQRAAACHCQGLPGFIPEGQFKHRSVFHHHGAVAGHRHIQLQHVPLEAGPRLQLHLGGGRSVRAGDGQAAALGNAAVHPHAGRLPLNRNRLGQRHTLGGQAVLGGGGVAQISKGDHRRGQRQPGQGQRLPPGPAGLRGWGSPGFRCRFGQRSRFVHAGQVPGRQRQHHEKHHGPQACQPPGDHRHTAGEELILGALAGIHHRQVQKAGEGKPGRRPQQPPAAPAGRRGQDKRQPQQQIPLVHPMPKGEHAHGVKGRQQQRVKPARLYRPHGQHAQGRRQRGQTQGAKLLPGDGQQGHRFVLFHPIAAQQLHQVKGVDTGIGVALGRAQVFFQQRGRGKAKGQRRRQHRGQRAHRTPHAPLEGRSKARRPLPKQGQQGAQGQHRPGQQCLGLHRQRSAVPQAPLPELAPAEPPQGQHHQKADHLIDLHPHAGAVHQRRAEGRKPGRPVGPADIAVPGFQPDVPHGPHQPPGAQNGHQAHQQPGGRLGEVQVQKAHQLAHQPQHQHIPRGIIREIIRCVEILRPILGDF